MRRGNPLMLAVFAVATMVIVVNGVMAPEHRTVSLALFLLGLVGTHRQYVNWRGASRSSVRS